MYIYCFVKELCALIDKRPKVVKQPQPSQVTISAAKGIVLSHLLIVNQADVTSPSFNNYYLETSSKSPVDKALPTLYC